MWQGVEGDQSRKYIRTNRERTQTPGWKVGFVNAQWGTTKWFWLGVCDKLAAIFYKPFEVWKVKEAYTCNLYLFKASMVPIAFREDDNFLTCLRRYHAASSFLCLYLPSWLPTPMCSHSRHFCSCYFFFVRKMLPLASYLTNFMDMCRLHCFTEMFFVPL